MLLDNLLHQRQCLRPVETLIALAGLTLQRIECVHIEPRQRPSQHAEEIRAHFAKKLCGKQSHFFQCSKARVDKSCPAPTFVELDIFWE